jgi:NADP-dependent 3-hydroxy acid dehydrogenase YdfG
MTQLIDHDMRPRTALITGSTGGIGRATALALAREGSPAKPARLTCW